MNTHIALLVATGLAATVSVQAQSTLTIDGTGSGSLNGVEFTDNTFEWTLTFPSTVAYTGWGPTQPVYAPLTSIITLNSGAPINVTGTTALWFYMPNENALALAPMYYSIPGYNILSVTSTSGWDGSSAYTSSYIDGSGFAYFVNIATDHGSLTMDSGSVNLVTISGDAPVPEPSTLVLAAMGGLGMLWQFRRRK